MQTSFIRVGKGLLHIDLPPQDEEVLPGVRWGNAAGFPTVAYWMLRTIETRLTNKTVQYKLGASLLEEIGACLLGGHGIPAENGLAAYEHMKEKGAFSGDLYSADQLLEWLSEPIRLREKSFKYRFAKQKSSYIHSAIKRLGESEAPAASGQELRNWLLDIKGVGLKTASWVARNWLDADDVAILDIHIYRAGLLGGFFTDSMTVEKDYLKLESRFIELAESMEVKTSELDSLMWFEMQQSPSVLKLLEKKPEKNLNTLTTNDSRANPYQVALI
ncbi:hypothetical protein [Teredinibacter turnerae]|uniref:8-oxoguanine DNA glycosylase n=1 Tax=Teredinibacter turnerae TaxID=2426 RepID=UPI0003750E97|nr:hypothetical protein [Teredinibacter turnerae]